MADVARKIVLPGGSGFLGRILSRWLSERGSEVVVLSRNPPSVAAPARGVFWDGATLGDWRHELDAAAAVINLAGRSVNCRYHARNRQAILASRIDSTRVLGQAIQQCLQPPAVWLNSSTATIYKHAFRPMDESFGTIGPTAEAKDAFSIEVAEAWERALKEADTPATRKVALRTAMVLGIDRASVYRILRRLARLGLGGAMAGGKQYVSWIHETDFCRAVDFLLDAHDIAGAVNVASGAVNVASGAVNVTAPQPLTNGEMMRLMREACGVSIGLPATRWMLEIGAALLGTETELIIKSRYVVPERLLTAGFEFSFPDFTGALRDLEGRLALDVGSKPRISHKALVPG